MLRLRIPLLSKKYPEKRGVSMNEDRAASELELELVRSRLCETWCYG